MKAFFRRLRKMFQEEKFVSIRWVRESSDEAIIQTTHGRYRGNCTVWHDAETGESVNDPFRTGWLADQWTREKWRRDDGRVE